MRKKWNIVVYRTIISILLLFNTMFFQIINTTVLAAGTAIDAKITQLQLLTDSGTPATEVAKSATIRMKFDFETPSTMMNKDDYFDIAIPKELDLTTAVTNPLTFDITDEGGNIVAKATISPTATSATTGGGTVRVTFNENANGKYNFKGNLFFDTKVNKKLVHDNETINIKTKVNNREDLTPDSKPVKINPDAALSKKEIIGKWGKSPTSPTVAAWGVRVNRTNQDLKNVVITDKITSNNGHFLDPSTMPAVKTTEQFKLLKVEYDAAGNVISWDGEVVDISDKITFNADKTEFRLELGDIGTQAYFLSYKSTVENGDIVQTNSAKITSDTFETQTSDGVWKYRSSGGSADGILAKRLKIRKVDIDTRVGLAGAKFLVTKPDGSTFQLETGTDGTILSQELIQGKYKVNGIGNNEEVLLYQAFDEMMGHQYGNVQQRINETGGLLDKEFSYLKNDWRNPSKENNKIKVFGMRNEYNSDTAGIIDYTSNAYGVAYVHEDETVRLGNSSGWYAGAVNNRFKFKDIGKSRENQTMIKAGVFKTMSPSFDHNGSLRWTIAGDVFAGRNEMKRRFLVVDDIFNAKADYTSYGAAFKTDLGYDVRLSERAHLRPYGALKMEYGRFTDIKEDSGEIRLEVDGNDYFSVKPEVGLEFKYVQPMALKTNLSVGLAAAYENELGRVANGKNKARVRYTEADWFGVRGEKEDRRGSGKFDLNVGVDNTRFGVTANLGYDTRGENIRGGLGFRLIY